MHSTPARGNDVSERQGRGAPKLPMVETLGPTGRFGLPIPIQPDTQQAVRSTQRTMVLSSKIGSSTASIMLKTTMAMTTMMIGSTNEVKPSTLVSTSLS